MGKSVGNTNVFVEKYSPEEYEILRGVFGNNEELLKAIRNSLLQKTLTEFEWGVLQNQLRGEGLKEIMKKVMFERDLPIMHQVDEWEIEDIRGRLADNAAQIIKAKALTLKYFEQEFENLFAPEAKDRAVKFNELLNFEGKSNEEIYINFIARSNIVKKVFEYVRNLKLLGYVGNMTPEERAKLSKQNSGK
jgi:hypothetical protein